jgi:predicted CopG family antitoxin
MSRTISIPEDLYDRLEKKKSPRQPFSGVIEGLLQNQGD